MQDYKTIYQPCQDEFVEKRSRFIGYIAPAATEEQAQEFIAQIRAKHWDATHNVYAYVLRDGQIRRYSDDGEPQGTAGIPVLEVLLKENVVDVVLVVTRYFGGIMLGAGGLVRAYSHGAKIALSSAAVCNMAVCKQVMITADYNLYGRICNLLPQFEALTLSSEFTDVVKLVIAVRLSLYDAFEKQMVEASNGKASITVLKQDYYDMARAR